MRFGNQADLALGGVRVRSEDFRDLDASAKIATASEGGLDAFAKNATASEGGLDAFAKIATASGGGLRGLPFYIFE